MEVIAAVLDRRNRAVLRGLSINTPYAHCFAALLANFSLVPFSYRDFARQLERVELLTLSWTKHAVNPLPEV